MTLEIVPIDFDEANELVARWHRHHQPIPGMKFAVGVACCGEIVGAAIVGRPVARFNDDGWTLEVTRCVTDGRHNACSALYGACRRVTFALGYRRLITYTLPTESGASLRGAGWKCLGTAGGGTWNRVDRPRVDMHPLQLKLKWEAAREAS